MRERSQNLAKPAIVLVAHMAVVAAIPSVVSLPKASAAERPNIVLVMADDMGHSQTGYRNHPLLKTPHLNDLATRGLRLDHFYAAGPVCSPTRASVLTGRTHERTGVDSHGYALRRQERTLAQLLRDAGYDTGHFGKWHLNGLRGPGAPLFAEDRYAPGVFGFDHWLSVSNFFDRDPILSRLGDWEEFAGDSSEIVMDQMLAWAANRSDSKRPFFAVVWYGTPHSPFRADADDVALLRQRSEASAAIVDQIKQDSQNHHGELVAMDRSLGALKKGLQSMGKMDNTLIWFTSDNGGLPGIEPSTTTPLRGNKGQLYEGGLRVPCVMHWPNGIEAGRISNFPACATDIAPTVLDVAGIAAKAIDGLIQPVDGISLTSVITGMDTTRRTKPLGFRYAGGSAIIDDGWKLLRLQKNKKKNAITEELYHLAADPNETRNLISQEVAQAERMRALLDTFNTSVLESRAGKDYPSGRVEADHVEPRFWIELPEYQAHFDAWADRPEYANWVERGRKASAKKAKATR
ncbi:MAG: sulfatase-like hydrolase/transferase [Planctomycetota bacterium]